MAMLARNAVRARLAVTKVSVPALAGHARSWSSIKDEHQYSAKATSHGSRSDGTVKLDVGIRISVL